MKLGNVEARKKALHVHRFNNFTLHEIPKEKKYIESKTNSLILLTLTTVITGFVLYFTNYNESVLKIGIFAILFNLYKIYRAYFSPLLVLNDEGITFRTVKIAWKNINKVEISWKNHALHLQINLRTGKVVNEKVENFNFMDYIYLYPILRAFKRTYRNKYTFNGEIESYFLNF